MNQVLEVAKDILKLAAQSDQPERQLEVRLSELLRLLETSPESDFKLGSGRADIVLRQQRLVIEVKAPGKAADSDAGKQQLQGYVSVLANETSKTWVGLLTDGCSWHAWLTDKAGHLDKTYLPSLILGPGQEYELVSWIKRLLNRQSGKAVLPDKPFETLLAPHLERLKEIDLRAQSSRKGLTSRQTQFDLWQQQLKAADLLAPGTNEQDLFVRHTFLVVVARCVALALSQDTPSNLTDQGFVSWLKEVDGANDWLTNLNQTIGSYDWQSHPGDVLRDIYQTVIDKQVRKMFGEYYTPDWLAQMIVDEVCDEAWLQDSLNEALGQKDDLIKGVGVLDPACGSGTFLYHTAKKLASHSLCRDLPPVTVANAVAKLVVGMDIHPVAVEIAKATLLRALPALPEAGLNALRVSQGDSLRLGIPALFEAAPDSYTLHTPGGAYLSLPVDFVSQKDLLEKLEQLVNFAKEGQDLPSYFIQGLKDSVADQLQASRRKLTDIIEREGNGIWAWFLFNQLTPYLLSEIKVNRIVANPPWVRFSEIQDESRKQRLQAAIGEHQLWGKAINKTGFDICLLFMTLCPNHYLVKDGKAGWITNAGALLGGNWQAWHEQRSNENTVDLSNLKAPPFSGASSAVHYVGARFPKQKLKLVLKDKNQPILRTDSWAKVQDSTTFKKIAPLPKAPSAWPLSLVRNGAALFPHCLVVVKTKETLDSKRTKVKTKSSQQKPWKSLGPQTGVIPTHWLKYAVFAKNLLPYTLTQELTLVITPNNKSKLLTSDQARLVEFWRKLDDLYIDRRGRGSHTPNNLVSRLNHHKGLSWQLDNKTPFSVIYNSSGGRLRAAVVPPQIITNGSIYRISCQNKAEAHFLAALLNSPLLKERFSQTQRSDRDFHTYFWSEIPLPRYDPSQASHRNLAKSSEKAQELTQEYLTTLDSSLGQTALAQRIRQHLAASHLAGELNQAVAQIMPAKYLNKVKPVNRKLI